MTTGWELSSKSKWVSQSSCKQKAGDLWPGGFRVNDFVEIEITVFESPFEGQLNEKWQVKILQRKK